MDDYGTLDLAIEARTFRLDGTVTIRAISNAGNNFLNWALGMQTLAVNRLVLNVPQRMDALSLSARFSELV